MSYWPFWAGGLALAAVALAHWFSLGRLMAVSGRFTALVNRLRWGAAEPEPEVSEAAMIAAMQAATLEAFGEGAAAPAASEPPSNPAERRPVSASRQPLWMHVLFFGGLTLGGLVAGGLSGTLTVSPWIRGETFGEFFGTGPASLWPLVVGGFLVGFGTRMAGGCTSGHGLCGVSRVQTGSLLATCAFFGAGIGASLLLERLL